jgi:4-hydroxybenzoate polyprenyltransferase
MIAETLRPSLDPKACAELTRPGNTRLPMLVTVVLGIHAHLSVVRIAALAVAIAAAYAIAAILNDLRDVETDRANGRMGPLVTGEITENAAKQIMLVAVGVLLFVQVFLRQPGGLAVFGLAVVLSFAYSSKSLRVQTRGLAGTASLGVCYGMLPLLLVASQQVHPTLSLVGILATVIATTASVLYKDFRDEEGDRANGKITPVVQFGRARTQELGVGLQIIAVALVAMHASWALLPAAGLLATHIIMTLRQRPLSRVIAVQRVLLPLFIIGCGLL